MVSAPSAATNFGRAEYDPHPKTSRGVIIHSETHPSQDTWYNNNNPSVTWERESECNWFSYVLDNKPSTVPENTILTTDTNKSYQISQMDFGTFVTRR